MRAIILAAGVGSRLHPITLEKPKTLVTVNNKPMIDHIVDALLYAGVIDIVVCVGYRSSQLVAHLTDTYGSTANLTFVENEVYAKTNNMHSLYLAREYLAGDVLLMNADLVFDKEIIAELVKAPGCAVAVDKGNYIEESMKIVVSHGGIDGISKQIPREAAYGSSIDVYKFDAEATQVLSSYIRHIIEVEGVLTQWTEVLLDRVFKEKLVKAAPFDIGDRKWFEIDNFDDLAAAEIKFNEHLPLLRAKTTFLLDKDGTVALGKQAIPGAIDFIRELDKNNKKWIVASNNSSRTSNEHAANLRRLLASDTETQVISSLDCAISVLRAKGVKSLYWVANGNVSNYLSSYFEFNSNAPDAVLLTYDDEIDYKKVVTAIRLINAEVDYYATHVDVVCPTESGDIPDIGTYIEMIAACTTVRPLQTFGKPTRDFLTHMLSVMESQEDDTVLIGDRLYTDIKCCEGTRVTSVLVLSGETSRTAYEFSNLKADIIVPSISSLREFIQ
jgi:HAD superfamily hydrolase (TIGR01450 family)